MENGNKIKGVDRDGEITGVKSELESTAVTESNDEAGKMALIEEVISEAERDIAEGTELISGNETKTDDTRDKHVIHQEAQVPTSDNVYNIRI